MASKNDDDPYPQTISLAGTMPPKTANALYEIYDDLIANMGKRRVAIVELSVLRYSVERDNEGLPHNPVIQIHQIELPANDDDQLLLNRALDRGAAARGGQLTLDQADRLE